MKFLQSVTFSLPERYCAIIKQYSIPYTINLDFDITPTKEVIDGIIVGHIHKYLMEIKNERVCEVVSFIELRQYYYISKETSLFHNELLSI